MTSSNGNIFRVTVPLCGEFTGPGEFPAQRSVTRSFDVFFDLRLNKRLNKQPWGWWFETPSWSLWRQCNEKIDARLYLLPAVLMSVYYQMWYAIFTSNHVPHEICTHFVLFCFGYITSPFIINIGPILAIYVYILTVNKPSESTVLRIKLYKPYSSRLIAWNMVANLPKWLTGAPLISQDFESWHSIGLLPDT